MTLRMFSKALRQIDSDYVLLVGRMKKEDDELTIEIMQDNEGIWILNEDE